MLPHPLDRRIRIGRLFAEFLAEQATVAEAGDFPSGDAVAGEEWGQDQVHYVGFGRAKTSGRRKHRKVVAIAQQEEVAGLYGSEESLDQASGTRHP